MMQLRNQSPWVIFKKNTFLKHFLPNRTPTMAPSPCSTLPDFALYADFSLDQVISGQSLGKHRKIIGNARKKSLEVIGKMTSNDFPMTFCAFPMIFVILTQGDQQNLRKKVGE